MRPELACCVPQVAPFPSGMRWVHSRSCPTANRNQKVRAEDLQRSKEHARFLHPAGKDLPAVTGHSAARMWRVHPYDCTCEPCRFIDAHLDDGVEV
jgi:hypothetical protein